MTLTLRYVSLRLQCESSGWPMMSHASIGHPASQLSSLLSVQGVVLGSVLRGMQAKTQGQEPLRAPFKTERLAAHLGIVCLDHNL